MSKIKLIIFDVYGVVLNKGYPNTAKALAKRFGGNWRQIFKIMYLKYFNLAAERKITQTQAWQLAVKELNLPIKWQKVREIHYRLMKTQPKIIELAKKLKKKYTVILLSKNTRSQLSDVKKRLNFCPPAGGFDYLINTWELGLPKASKATIRYLAKEFKVKPSEMLYIDDQQVNLVEPQKMGVKTIFYRNFGEFKRELNRILSFRT